MSCSERFIYIAIGTQKKHTLTQHRETKGTFFHEKNCSIKLTTLVDIATNFIISTLCLLHNVERFRTLNRFGRAH